jgi:hypothetical protein
MKKTAILIHILLISASAFSQRVIPVAKRTFPKTQNQITKQDSLSDEFGLEYTERPFQGVEEDTAAINADFLKREKLKEGKITDPEREVITFDYESIIYTDMKDFEKAEAERKKSQKSSPANKK